jgi:hypothetical protein
VGVTKGNGRRWRNSRLLSRKAGRKNKKSPDNKQVGAWLLPGANDVKDCHRLTAKLRRCVAANIPASLLLLYRLYFFSLAALNSEPSFHLGKVVSLLRV